MSKKLSFYVGNSNVVLGETEERAFGRVRKDLEDALSSKHVSFLLGSGCSSHAVNGEEVGIPTMAPLAKEFFADEHSYKIPEVDEKLLVDALGLNIRDGAFATNLELLMEALFAYQIAISQSAPAPLGAAAKAVGRTIEKVKGFVREKCLVDMASADAVLRAYETFYRKLATRERSLARAWVFTTNYDLFNETAMDRLGIPYINGFQGTVERRFNPAVFRQALAERLDVSSKRWSSVDSLVYFAKLHGSLGWKAASGSLFPVVERDPKLVEDSFLIYPTPAKQNASFASPYSDMFREFQGQIAQQQSVLFTIGYSFSDEHVNSIIYQGLTIPTFRLVAFADPSQGDQLRTLRELDDPRIWIIGTEPEMASGPSSGVAVGVSGGGAADSKQVENEATEAVGTPEVATEDAAPGGESEISSGTEPESPEVDYRAHFFSNVVSDLWGGDAEDLKDAAIALVRDTLLGVEPGGADNGGV